MNQYELHSLQGHELAKLLRINPSDDWKVMYMFPYTSSRVFLCHTHGASLVGRPSSIVGAEFQWMPEHGEVPATSQFIDLSSVPIDKAQHRRAPEISQQRDKRQKTHTVRWCANCLWLLTSLTPAGWISVVRSSPPARGPFCVVWS